MRPFVIRQVIDEVGTLRLKPLRKRGFRRQ